MDYTGRAMKKFLFIFLLCSTTIGAQYTIPYRTSVGASGLVVLQVGNDTTVTNQNYSTATLTSAIPSGAGIVVILGGELGAGNAVTSCSDSSLNTYTVDASVTNADNVSVAICAAYAVNSISSGGTVTVNFPADSTARSIYVYEVPPTYFATSSWADTNGTYSTTYSCSTGCTATTSANVAGNDVVFTGWDTLATSHTITTGYTTLIDDINIADSGRILYFGFKTVVSGSGAASATDTLPTSNDNVGFVSAYREQ
ncbi:Uncharacterised protein [uncultured archaeon]|nr:Uncharacterised protein [uncultured archaeon]